MILRVLRYLFPKRRLQSKLPLLSRRYSSKTNAFGQPPESANREIRLLMASGVALTPADGWRLICEYRKPTREIIKAEKRKRRPWGRWRRAWRRFKRLW